jgi:hypothetical protein
MPLVAAVAPLALQAAGLGPKAPKAPQAPQLSGAAAERSVFQAQEPPKAPTLADASVERARRASKAGNIRQDTLRTAPQGLLDDATTTSGGSLL